MVLSDTLTGVIQDPFDRVCEMSVERGHLILRDGLLELLQGGLLHILRAGRIGEVEDMLGEGEIRELDVLRIGSHVGDGNWDGSI